MISKQPVPSKYFYQQDHKQQQQQYTRQTPQKPEYLKYRQHHVKQLKTIKHSLSDESLKSHHNSHHKIQATKSFNNRQSPPTKRTTADIIKSHQLQYGRILPNINNNRAILEKKPIMNNSCQLFPNNQHFDKKSIEKVKEFLNRESDQNKNQYTYHPHNYSEQSIYNKQKQKQVHRFHDKKKSSTYIQNLQLHQQHGRSKSSQSNFNNPKFRNALSQKQQLKIKNNSETQDTKDNQHRMMQNQPYSKIRQKLLLSSHPIQHQQKVSSNRKINFIHDDNNEYPQRPTSSNGFGSLFLLHQQEAGQIQSTLQHQKSQRKPHPTFRNIESQNISEKSHPLSPAKLLIGLSNQANRDHRHLQNSQNFLNNHHHPVPRKNSQSAYGSKKKSLISELPPPPAPVSSFANMYNVNATIANAQGLALRNAQLLNQERKPSRHQKRTHQYFKKKDNKFNVADNNSKSLITTSMQSLQKSQKANSNRRQSKAYIMSSNNNNNNNKNNRIQQVSEFNLFEEEDAQTLLKPPNNAEIEDHRKRIINSEPSQQIQKNKNPDEMYRRSSKQEKISPPMSHKIDKHILSSQYASNLAKKKFKQDNTSHANSSGFQQISFSQNLHKMQTQRIQNTTPPSISQNCLSNYSNNNKTEQKPQQHFTAGTPAFSRPASALASSSISNQLQGIIKKQQQHTTDNRKVKQTSSSILNSKNHLHNHNHLQQRVKSDRTPDSHHSYIQKNNKKIAESERMVKKSHRQYNNNDEDYQGSKLPIKTCQRKEVEKINGSSHKQKSMTSSAGGGNNLLNAPQSSSKKLSTLLQISPQTRTQSTKMSPPTMSKKTGGLCGPARPLYLNQVHGQNQDFQNQQFYNGESQGDLSPACLNPSYRTQSPLPAKSDNQTPTDMSPNNACTNTLQQQQQNKKADEKRLENYEQFAQSLKSKNKTMSQSNTPQILPLQLNQNNYYNRQLLNQQKDHKLALYQHQKLHHQLTINSTDNSIVRMQQNHVQEQLIKFSSLISKQRNAVNDLTIDYRSGIVFSAAENIKITSTADQNTSILNNMYISNNNNIVGGPPPLICSPGSSIQSPLVGSNLNQRFTAVASSFGGGSDASSRTSQYHTKQQLQQQHNSLISQIDLHKRGVLSLAYSSRSDLLFTGGKSDGKLKVYSPWRKEVVGGLDIFERSNVYNIMLNESETKLVASGGAKNGTVQIIDIERLQCLMSQSFIKHPPSATSMCLFQANILMSGGSDGTFKMWDLRDRACQFSTRAHHDAVTSIGKLSPSMFFTTSKDGIVKLWDSAMRKVVHQKDLIDSINDALIVADKIVLASKNLHILSMNTEESSLDVQHDLIQIIQTKTMNCRVKCLAFDKHSNTLYSGHDNGETNSWKISNTILCTKNNSVMLPISSPITATVGNSLIF